MRVHVQHLAGKEQTRRQLAHHRARVDLPNLHAAAGDDRLLDGPRAGHGKRQRLEVPRDRRALLARDLVDRLLGRQTAQLREHRAHARGHQRHQHGGQLLAHILREFALKPQIHLLGREPRLHVQHHLNRRNILRQVAAQLDDQRAAHAEVRKEHLAQLVVDLLFAHLRADAHVLERQAHQQTGPLFRHRQPHQRAGKRRHGMAVFLRKRIAVAGGAGGRIGQAAGGDHDRLRVQRAAAGERHGKAAILPAHAGNRRIQRHLHARVPHAPGKGARHVARLVAHGKDTVAALHLRLGTQHGQQRSDVLMAELPHGRVEELAVARHLPEEVLGVAGVCHVAASLAGDVDLLAQLFVLFQQRHLRARPGGLQRGHHARRAAADDDDVKPCLFQHRPCTHPRFLPSGGNARSAPPCGAGPARRSAR